MAVRISEAEGMGRVVVATRHFQPGETVLEEEPIFVWQGGCLEYLQSFQNLSTEKKAQILDMYHPPLESNIEFVKEFRAAALHFACKDVPLQEALKLCAILKTNAHAWKGERGVYEEVVGGRPVDSKSALFVMASKVAHSCLPNCMYTSKVGAKLRYQAIRSIREGEQITFSYLEPSTLWATPITLRRKQLLCSKAFLCHCPRCSKADDCRSFQCPKGCGGLVRPMMGAERAEGDSCCTWVCACGEVDPELMSSKVKMEAIFKEKLDRVELQAQTGGLESFEPDWLEDLVLTTAKQLSAVHHLVVRVLDLSATICASQAIALQQLGALVPPAKPRVLRIHAAGAACRATAICECLAAGCGGGFRCGASHAPCPERFMEMFHAGQDLMTLCGARGPPPELPRSVLRYVPAMLSNFGPDDADALKLQSTLQSAMKPAAEQGRRC